MMEMGGCRGCSASVRLAVGEVERILAAVLAAHPAPLADEKAAAARLSICRACADLQYGTTCRHCGCLVEVRTRLSASACPAPLPRWRAEAPAD